MDSHAGMRLGRLVALLALSLVPAVPAAAASDWLPAQNVSAQITQPPAPCPPCIPTPFALSPSAQVAATPDGAVIAVWAEPAGAGYKFMWSEHPAAGEFSTPREITTLSGPLSAAPEIAVDDAGNATVLFTRTSIVPVPFSINYTVEAATRPAGGDFGAPVPISPAGPDIIGLARLAVNGSGEAIAAWTRGSAVEAATRGASGGFSPSAPVPGAAAQLATPPSVALDDQGNALVAWLGAGTAKASYRPAGGAFQTVPDTVSGTGASNLGDVKFDGSGDAVLVWNEGAGSVHRAFRPKGESFGAPDDITPGPGAFAPSLGLAADGRATVAWLRGGNAEASTRPAGGEFGSVAPLGPATIFGVPAVAMNDRGDTVVAWPAQGGAPFFSPRVDAVTSTAGGPLGAVEQAADALGGSSPFFAPIDASIDAEGNAALAHTRTIPPTISNPVVSDRITVAGFDAAAPRLRGLEIPSNGLVGQSLSFGANPVDAWSPVTSTDWAFGDGATASGNSVQHIYGAPGNPEASVTATDALGNSRTERRSVAIAAPVPGLDEIDPILGSVSMLRRTFRVSGAPTPVTIAGKRKPKKGTAFRFAVSEIARVRIAIQRPAVGRRSKGRCRKPSRKLRGKKRCTRWVRSGALVRNGEVGRNTVPFSGRVGNRALKPGRYRAAIKATDAAGNASDVERITFRVVR